MSSTGAAAVPACSAFSSLQIAVFGEVCTVDNDFSRKGLTYTKVECGYRPRVLWVNWDTHSYESAYRSCFAKCTVLWNVLSVSLLLGSDKYSGMINFPCDSINGVLRCVMTWHKNCQFCCKLITCDWQIYYLRDVIREFVMKSWKYVVASWRHMTLW